MFKKQTNEKKFGAKHSGAVRSVGGKMVKPIKKSEIMNQDDKPKLSPLEHA
jgi:hypothetical protein